MKAVTAYLGLGGNLGDPEEAIRKALALLEADGSVKIIGVSSFYRTEPVGMARIEGQAIPWFVNAVAKICTPLSPEKLLERCLSIEQQLGRDRSHNPAYTGALSRTLDVDILFYGDSIVHMPGLTIPHPRVQERVFTLVPLRELAPDLMHPELGMTIDALARNLDNQTGLELLEPLSTVH